MPNVDSDKIIVHSTMENLKKSLGLLLIYWFRVVYQGTQ